MNAFPVRVQIREEESFADLSRRIQTQILTSQEKATISPDVLGRRLGKEDGFFDHFLNFHNYPGILSSSRSAELLTGAKLLDLDSYDNLSTGFGLYFLSKENRLLCRFAYDENQISDESVWKMKDAFYRIMMQLPLKMCLNILNTSRN